MTEEEQFIINFLKDSPDTFYARKEIARKAVKRTLYEKNPRWIDIPLASLEARSVVEMNEGGHYRLSTGNSFRRSG